MVLAYSLNRQNDVVCILMVVFNPDKCILTFRRLLLVTFISSFSKINSSCQRLLIKTNLMTSKCSILTHAINGKIAASSSKPDWQSIFFSINNYEQIQIILLIHIRYIIVNVNHVNMCFAHCDWIVRFSYNIERQ